MELIADSDKFPDLLEKARSEKKTKNLEKIKQNIYKSQMKRIKKGDSKLKSSVSYFVIIDELIDINDNLLSLAEELSVAIPWTERKKDRVTKQVAISFQNGRKEKRRNKVFCSAVVCKYESRQDIIFYKNKPEQN